MLDLDDLLVFVPEAFMATDGAAGEQPDDQHNYQNSTGHPEPILVHVHSLSVQIRPMTIRMITMSKTIPKPPLG